MSPLRIPGWLIVLLLAASAAPAHQPVPAAQPPRRQAPERAQPAPPAAPLLGDQTDGSRARPVHRIALRDSEGEVIRPTDQPLLPFSPAQTCGAGCHDIATIGKGWHFNTSSAASAGARRGEPWILVDAATATQLPLSYHAWPGTFRPDQVGVTPWAFAKMFGGRTPGGLTAAHEASSDLQVRWVVSGDLEPNCLACHDASPGYDHAEYARQIGLENFRWAVAAASGMALVTGSAREMPGTFDYLMPRVEDALLPRMPTIAYAPERFLPGAKVIFDIAREVPAPRCYFCHTNADVAETGQGRWNTDEDVHLARGMACVDCHRNGLDHAMTRGYESPPAGSRAPAADLSCRGCHLAGEPDRVFARGRVGAPYPRHAGLPPVHLQKLSCTACHSGPRPEATTRRLKTSLAHRLGAQGVNKASDALPHLYYPVFERQDDGTTTPNRLVWPAFWGRMEGSTVTPVAPARVKALMARARVELQPAADGSWPALDNATLARILGLLAAEGIPVYVAGGKLYRLDKTGNVAAEDHPSAVPYLWQMAHDVRPASLALGARSCQECHGEKAPIFFGTVTVDSPLASGRGGSWQMHRFQKNLDTAHVAAFANSFRYRPWLKGTVTASAAALLLLVLAFVTPALGRLSAATRTARWTRLAVNAAGLASCGLSVVTGWTVLLSGEPLTGSTLLLHVGSAPVFAASAVLVALFWARRNHFTGADWNRVCRPFGSAVSRGATSYVVLLRKVNFWVALAALIPAVASATLAMFPAFASVWQATLFRVHRYAVATLAGAALGFAVFALIAWLGRHVDDRDAGPSSA